MRTTSFPKALRAPATGALLLCLLAAALAASCKKEAVATEKAPRAVSVYQVQSESFALEAEYPATILPASQVNVTPKVGGRVAAVQAKVGDFVKAGQSLLTIEKGDYSAQYRQAQGALESARANLQRSDEAGQESQILQARSAMDQAQIQRDEVQKAWDKTKRLYDGGVVPKQQMDDVDARLRAALVQLDTAKKALALVQDKAGQQASRVLSGQVDSAQAQADLARSQLDAATIVSPLSGHVTYRDAEPGAMIGTASLAFIVIDDTTVLAEAGLSDRSVGFVHKGMSLTVTINALRGAAATRKGKVDWVNPAADPRNLLYEVRVTIDNSDGTIRPGMLARIRFPIEARREAILVPERAVFTENGLDYVMTAEAGIAKKTGVELGESDGSMVEVRSGLEAGKLVIVAGQEFLTDGDRIVAAE